MRVFFHKDFKKQYKKLPKKIQTKFGERLGIFIENTNNPLLNVHALKGEDRPLSSMNITGNYRALFVKKKNEVTFYAVGTHSELYS